MVNKPQEESPTINPTTYTEICEKSELMFKAFNLSGMKPIFISGDASGVAVIVFVNLKTEHSSILRVNNGVGCIVGHGTKMILRVPEGLQQI